MTKLFVETWDGGTPVVLVHGSRAGVTRAGIEVQFAGSSFNGLQLLPLRGARAAEGAGT